MKKHIISVLMLVLALAVCSPAGADVIYTNGPINGNKGYRFNFPLAIANSFLERPS